MRDKVIKATLVGIGTVVTGVVAGLTVNAIGKVSMKAIETNNEKEKEELQRQLKEFEARKEKAIKLEQLKDKKFKEQEERLKELQEEVKALEKLKGELTDSSNLITVMSGLMGELKDIKGELKQVRNGMEYMQK